MIDRSLQDSEAGRTIRSTVITVSPDKKILYIVGRGAEGPGNQQNARTMYKVAMQAEGFKSRAKQERACWF